MKLIAATAAIFAATNAQTTPVSSPWKINCQTTTSPDGSEAGPAFTNIRVNSDGTSDIYWSSFARGYGAVSASGGYGPNSSGSFCDSYDNSSFTGLVENGVFDWPNQVQAVPSEIFGDGYFVVADGFATPGTYDGCVAIVNSNIGRPAGPSDVQFLTNGCGQGNFLQTKYYYHYTQWYDMDGDGDLDLVTARSSSITDPTNVTESALLWLQNPGKGFSTTAKTWKAFVIDDSINVADTAFNVMTYNNVIYAVAGGFSSGTLALFSGANWAATANVNIQVIATDTPFYFDTHFDDVNMDGIPDVIVTIGSYGVGNGKLVIYPGVDNNGAYTVGDAVTVYDQFPVFDSSSLGSPGNAFVFHYSLNSEAHSEVPSILISGDDDGYMYIADPNDTDPANFDWTFSTNVIYKTSNFNPFVTPFTAPTVGQPTLADVNGDGCIDIVVAGYSLKQIVFLEQKSTRGCQVKN